MMVPDRQAFVPHVVLLYTFWDKNELIIISDAQATP